MSSTLLVLVSTLCSLSATVMVTAQQEQQQEIMTPSQLAQAYFGINVPAGPNTKLPGDSVQALRMHGIGTQNYICTELNETSGVFGWMLQFPLAKLWLYNGTTVDTSRSPDGMQYFANIGSSPGWDLGTNCDAGTDPSTRKCDTYTARWRGKSPIADKQDDAIDWLLEAKDEDNMPPIMLMLDDASTMNTTYNEFWNYNWMQRLDTVGGMVANETSCTGIQDLNKTVASPYECDYVLAFTPISIQSSTSPDDDDDDVVDLPSNCFQAMPLFGNGVQEYQFWDGQWILSQPKATLQAYSTNQSSLSLISGSQGLIGSHYFANVGDSGTLGSGAGWVLGGNCSGDSCLNLVGKFRGKLNASSTNGDDNINLLLIQKDAENTPNSPINFLNKYTWMQRLTTVGGIPPATNGSQGELFSSPYTSDYILALCIGQENSSNDSDDNENKNNNTDTSTASDGSNVDLKIIISFSLFVISFCI